MVFFFPFLALFGLFAFSILTPVVYQLRRSLALSWLVALTGAIISWILILITGFHLPRTISIIEWNPVGLFPESPLWLVDQISWSFAFSLVTLLLAVILTDVAREFEADPMSWAGSLALTGLGVTSIFSGNSVTLMLGWAALDLTELFYFLQHNPKEENVRQALLVFSVRAAGILSLLVGVLYAATQGFSVQFERIPQVSGIFLLLAVVLRLGILPSHAPYWSEASLRRGIGTVARLVPPAASLVFLARVAEVGLPENQNTLLFFLTAITAIYAGVSWFNAANELEGRPYFILCLAALAVGAAIRGQQISSLVWGISLIFVGGFIFLYSSRGRNIRILGYLFAITTAILPFTPSWYGGQLYTTPINLWHSQFLLAHVFLLAGYIQHAQGQGESLESTERWVRLIYPAGLAVLLISQFVVAWIGGYLMPDHRWSIQVGRLIPGIFIILTISAWIRFGRRIPRISFRAFRVIRNLFSFDWLFLVFRGVYKTTGRAIHFITLVLEGEGGVLWALLLLTLLIAFLRSGAFGGV